MTFSTQKVGGLRFFRAGSFVFMFCRSSEAAKAMKPAKGERKAVRARLDRLAAHMAVQPGFTHWQAPDCPPESFFLGEEECARLGLEF